MRGIFTLTIIFLLLVGGAVAFADPPVSSYIFPAGGQRGTTVSCRAAGLNLSSECGFGLVGTGIDAPARVRSVPTLVLIGPYHHNPIAQQAWDYPKDMEATIKIDAGAPLGLRHWSFTTAEGATQLRPFVVGDLPEALEEEQRPASAVPQGVSLPVTINGRIYPRADIDEYAFAARAGEDITCDLMSQRLGHKLDARLDLRAEDGRVLAQNDDSGSRDPLLVFKAPADGTYVLRVHDIAFEGDQDYVYRLTVRTGPFVTHTFPAGGRRGAVTRVRFHGVGLGRDGFIDREVTLPSGPASFLDWEAVKGSLPAGCHVHSTFALGDDPEFLDVEPGEGGAHALRFEPPAVINGQIGEPGDADEFVFAGRKSQPLEIELLGRRLGSPITAVWSLHDGQGKEAARKEGDGRLEWAPPADGDYTLRIRELHRETHGGSDHVYRVAVRAAAPDFRLSIDRDAVGVLPGQASKVKLSVLRVGGFQGEVQLAASELPAGVALAPGVIAAGQNEVEVSFQASTNAPIGATRRVIVVGSALLDGRRLLRAATVPAPPATGAGIAVPDSLAVTVVHPALFTIGTEEVYGAAHRGATYLQRFVVERKPGFAGEILLSLADRQTRYLQGVTGPSILLKPDEAELVYPVFLPEGMDLNRTVRVLLMGAARITDSAGNVQFVTHTTQKQVIARVEPALLTLSSDGACVEARRGQALKVPLRVGRAQGLAGAVVVEAQLPPGRMGPAPAPATVNEGEETVTLTIQVASDAEISPGDRILFRATARRDGYPIVAERSVEIQLVPGRDPVASEK